MGGARAATGVEAREIAAAATSRITSTVTAIDEAPIAVQDAVAEWEAGARHAGPPSAPAGRPSGVPKHGRGVRRPSLFESAKFEARLHELKFMPSGELRVVILIPESDGAVAVTLREAYAVALQVDVRKREYGG